MKALECEGEFGVYLYFIFGGNEHIVRVKRLVNGF